MDQAFWTREVSNRIIQRASTAMLEGPILDNTIRGYFCEFMVAEALGKTCISVGAGWNAWDLQLGPSNQSFPKRIRIQVKNTAALQLWSKDDGRLSDCSWNLTYRKLPAYFNRDNPTTQCEAEGFLCDVFILCHHPNIDKSIADQTNPSQWRFYIAPVVGPYNSVSESELAWLQKKSQAQTKATLVRKPKTLEIGIRGRAPIKPLSFQELTIFELRRSLGIDN